MKNLGEKLRAAREKLGLSLRDVADATRLRSNVIENMESGEFSFDLPEIYKRGFLRIYAAFLKLDVSEIVDEYSRAVANQENKSYGMPAHLPGQKSLFSNDEEVSTESRYDKDKDTFPDGAPEPVKGGDKNDGEVSYLKLGVIFVGVILAVVIVVATISSIMKSSAPDVNPDLETRAEQSETAPAAEIQDEKLSVSAKADTFVVVYYENSKSAPLYNGPLQMGGEKVFKLTSPIIVKAIDAEKLSLKRNGSNLDLKGLTGIRQIRISPLKK